MKSTTKRVRRAVATGVAVTAVTTGLVAANATSASASGREASGIVAVHSGSWGYQETVYGKATTRQLATSPIWDYGPIFAGAAIASLGPAAALASVPVAVDLVSIKVRANQAVASGQCFAMVRTFFGTWPAKTWQDCR